jgi:hypothetical protein
MSQGKPSRSPSPIPFSIVDLTKYWPVHRLAVNIPPRELVATEIAPNDNHGGCTVLELSRGAEVPYRIPSHYRDALCILSAKILWLQMNCALLIKTTKLQNEDDVPLLNLLDGLRRSLTFSITLRNLFYTDVESLRIFPPDFRSKHLDSWLYVEFHAIVHNPPIYREYSKMKNAEKHPLDITVQGRVTLPIENIATNEIFISFHAEWLDWAAKNNAEWVLEDKPSLQGKGKGKQRRRLAHLRNEITNDKFIEYLEKKVQTQGKVAGGMSGDLVKELLGEQVRGENMRSQTCF